MNTTSLDKFFVIDIETVPQFSDYTMLSTDWQRRWLHKIAKTIPETTTPEESYRQKAGILAEFGKIICISIGCFHNEKDGLPTFLVKSIFGEDEKEVLKKFLRAGNKFCEKKNGFWFAGHNIREFDIPYICRRLLINGLKLPEYLCLHDKKPWQVEMLDTLHWWKFGDIKNYISLDLLAGVMNVPTSKTDIDGSMVQDVYYKDKDLKRIADYCQRDVEVVANLLLRFNNMPLLKSTHVRTVVVE
ncbi:MAG: ribonuclease H-like domain-containing protein [Bacteroidota bacterium]|nr:ribonuclease H-like domain-containing protein [Bacteroidota bacterium]